MKSRRRICALTGGGTWLRWKSSSFYQIW